MLTIGNLEVSISGSRILRGVNLKVPDASVTCLMGRNGVGKTTTLKSIVGLTKPGKGSIQLNGVELLGNNPETRSRMGIGYVPQGREIFPHLTVQETLMIGAIAHCK